MDRFCRGCLVRYDEPTELLQYTEKNRRLFVYSTGLQVKHNDAFTFQLCKSCYVSMKVACNFKKQCRNSDKRLKSYKALKETDDSVDLCTFLRNNDESWTFRFPAILGSSSPAYQRVKDEDNESTTTSIRNFMTDMMPETDLPDTEARIIREVIEEEADLLDDSLDSHWLQDDASIDTDFRLDFSFSPFSTPRSVNNDRYTPKKLIVNKTLEKTDEHKENCAMVKKILDMPLITEESNHPMAVIPIKEERAYDEQIDSLDAVNDILRYESDNINDMAGGAVSHCTVDTIDRNLEEALKNADNKEFSLDDLLVSPKVIPGIRTPPTPLINNILFGEKLDTDENSNNSQRYTAGQCIEKYENVIGHVEINHDLEFNINVKMEEFDIDEMEVVNEIKVVDEIKAVDKIKAVDEIKTEQIDVDTFLQKDNNQSNVTNFYCNMCKRTFKSLSGLKRHCAFHNKPKERILICDYCGNEFNDRTNLRRHIKNTHLLKPPPSKLECDSCKLSFTSEYTLRMHKRSHTGETERSSPKRKRFVCAECGATTDKSSNHRIHVKRHQKKYTVFCCECNKGFYRQAELTIHTRYHTGEKPFACSHCEMRFARQDGLTRHIKCHLDLKPFKCTYCKSRFVNSTNLKNHYKKSKSCCQSRDNIVRDQIKLDNDESSQVYVTEENVIGVKTLDLYGIVVDS